MKPQISTNRSENPLTEKTPWRGEVYSNSLADPSSPQNVIPRKRQRTDRLTRALANSRRTSDASVGDAPTSIWRRLAESRRQSECGCAAIGLQIPISSFLGLIDSNLGVATCAIGSQKKLLKKSSCRASSTPGTPRVRPVEE